MSDSYLEKYCNWWNAVSDKIAERIVKKADVAQLVEQRIRNA